jgi:hypothetical protein
VTLKSLIEKYPIQTLLVAAFIPRFIAVIFSKGYGMHDDHFLVIEAAQSWIDGFDYNRWLPWNQTTPQPTGHSWFYVGIHYLLLSGMQKLGAFDPQLKMYFIRLLHALYSLLSVALVYKIVFLLSGHKTKAFYAGLLMAVVWFFPILSVRNLTEMVSVPPLLAATYYFCKPARSKWIIWAGAFLALAVAIRFQNVFMAGGFGLVLLIHRNVKHVFLLAISFIATLFITQLTDLWLWGSPFAELREYVMYNLANKETYFSAPWFQYFLTVGGLLLPPLGAILLFNYFRFGYKWLWLFVPSLMFFAFHSYFPNKQERFIIPMFAYVVMIGVLSWDSLRFDKFKRVSIYIFAVLNLILLSVVSWSYTKRSRVEAMYMLGQNSDYKGLLVENTTDYEEIMLPRYYAANWSGMYYLSKASDVQKEGSLMRERPDEQWPNYAFFFDRTDLENRISAVESHFQIELETVGVAAPSFLDFMLYKLNPVNRNEEIFVYRIKRNS